MNLNSSRLISLLVVMSLPLLPVLVQAQQTNFTGSQIYEVVDVIDGDTVKLMIDGRTTTVRLIGIDTPETVHPTKPVQPYGKHASEFLHNLLDGGSVFLEYGQERTDKYGRLLAYLYRAPDGLFVNLEIVRQGYGKAYTRYPFKYKNLFVRWDSLAKVRSRGLWRLIESQEEGGGQESPAFPGASKTAVAPKNTDSVTVYVTRSGGKYHKDNCRYLSKSKKAIDLVEASAKYSPCKVCKPPVGQAGPSYRAPRHDHHQLRPDARLQRRRAHGANARPRRAAATAGSTGVTINATSERPEPSRLRNWKFYALNRN